MVSSCSLEFKRYLKNTAVLLGLLQHIGVVACRLNQILLLTENFSLNVANDSNNVWSLMAEYLHWWPLLHYKSKFGSG